MEHRTTITGSEIAGSNGKQTFIDRLDFVDVVGHVVASIISDGNNGYSLLINGVEVGTGSGVAKEGVALATVAALPSCTYDNGDDGVGATLTGDANGRLNVDGVDASNGERILIKDQSSSIQNGIYTVTEQGSGGAAFVLTRAVDFNASTDIRNGSTTICQNGGTNSGKTFYVSSASEPVIGTNAITFSETSGGGGVEAVVGGSGITIDDSDPANPVVINTGVQGLIAGPGIFIDSIEPATPVVSVQSNLFIESIGSGDGIDIDLTDPDNPIINNVGVLTVVPGSGIAVDNTDPANPVIQVNGAPHAAVPAPVGGIVEDSVARDAINMLIARLVTAGVLTQEV